MGKTRPSKKQRDNANKMSRQPPLPPGPPPARSYNDSYDQYRGGDSYYPGDRHNQPPPPPAQLYQFRGSGGESYRPGYDQRLRSPPRYAYSSGEDDRSYRPSYDAPRQPNGDRNGASYSPSYDQGFNFRYDAPPGLDYRASDQYRPRPRSPPRGSGRENIGPRNNENNQRRFPRGSRGGRGGPRMASDRAFLKTNREPTPELMPGMNEDTSHGVKYKPIEDLSDSEEAEMDLSNSDNEDESQQPKKKQARTETQAADGDSVPRWSNPDPYTALPPPDESQVKKKDVVKLIRKARVAASPENNEKTEAAADDFISFDFDDDEVDGNMAKQFGLGVEGAPTGPRSSKNDSSRQQGMQEQINGPGSHLNLRDRSFNSINASVSNIKAGTVDIRSNLQAVSSVPSRENERPGVSSSSKSSMQFSLPNGPASNAKSAPISLVPDPALGNRKRNIDDEIKGPPRIHEGSLGKKKQAVSGVIVGQWRSVSGQSPTPWVSIDHSDSANMGVWLHKEIMDFYHYVKPRGFEQFIRVKLVEELRAKVRGFFSQDADILSFGSFPAGLYLPTADMDLVCVSNTFMRGTKPMFHRKDALFRFRNFIQDHKIALDNKVEVVSGAKVPLVKYVDRVTGLKIDISFENDTGLIANKTFQDWKATFPAMPILVSLIKHLLAMRGLNEPVNGGIGGFSVICLVVSLLQNMPQVQSRTMVPEHHLGEILMEFFDLYGNQFDIGTTAISLNPPGYVSKAQANVPYKRNNPNKFCIIDPNQPSNDISGGASNSTAIVKLFSGCYQDLQKRMSELQYSENRSCETILGAIIAGNYSSFRLQREHLAHVHEKLFGPVDRDAA
ncbi:hypothetical protein EG329_009126 [Mollisiaceae sp. DMI_Dod_QoI]|nr:hypothetical protein EG329_009126 [Helotiales sp. DMI_Dod_QoI]